MNTAAARTWLAAAGLGLVCACAPALRKPPPVAVLGNPAGAAAPAASSRADVDRLLADAEAAFGRRPDMREATTAYSTFLAAARADETRVEGLLGAARTAGWIIEHEPGEERRTRLATEAVQACQWCVTRAPASIACRYRLALALGQQARERPSTSKDGLTKMIALLEEVAAEDPTHDNAGPHRVLALVLLRAPGWPAGPGDPEAALVHARKANELAPDDADNLLVLGEALAKNDDPTQARLAYARAQAIARTRAAAGDPDASEIVTSADRALRTLPR